MFYSLVFSVWFSVLFLCLDGLSHPRFVTFSPIILFKIFLYHYYLILLFLYSSSVHVCQVFQNLCMWVHTLKKSHWLCLIPLFCLLNLIVYLHMICFVGEAFHWSSCVTHYVFHFYYYFDLGCPQFFYAFIKFYFYVLYWLISCYCCVLLENIQVFELLYSNP